MNMSIAEEIKEEQQNFDKKWSWCMDYCKQHRIPPANFHFWQEAKAAYEFKFLNSKSEVEL